MYALYRYFGGADFLRVYARHHLSCSWSIEAGCHDGTDTLQMIQTLGLEQVFAFEPDVIAREKAKKLLEPFLGTVVTLSHFGLSDISGRAELAKNVSFGDGSSQVRKIASSTPGEMSSISLMRLDDVKINRDSGGLLWLDVEGHAVQALAGAKSTLRRIDVAKIEIQMHYMSSTRIRDAFDVIQICRDAGLVPVYFPLYPGFFGDIVFIRRTRLKYVYRFFAIVNHSMFLILHKFVYPIVGKPSANK